MSQQNKTDQVSENFDVEPQRHRCKLFNSHTSLSLCILHFACSQWCFHSTIYGISTLCYQTPVICVVLERDKHEGKRLLT